MSELWGHAIGVMIVLLMGIFLGIWIWAWRDRHRVVFQRMADLPMEDPVEARRQAKAEKEETT
ncbi:cytochrome c oxidase subunit [Alcanivorax sp. 521-1]|uniref:Cytochrome c oxidase subunit n=1 Tax=Alloalcanivorax profundimaris TaxID=2735259 RepID=A0ABS0AQQ4_9GAMM|nr:cbb3-type cytochrome c oxidase subunit 3 [Alloalcanivorax profundimaris]MBF5056458.1 cytochrome c oxidase subunit [Alloalcanivorax profundimaris]